MSELITVSGGAKPEITILDSEEHVPWAGHTSRYAMPEIYKAISQHRTTLLFVNTRSQAEMLFQELWRINEDNLPIALHHGSLDVGQRRRVEKAMESNSLRAIVATSTLDLGIDWGDVDLVVHVGAPKGASRLAQRIGRSNHRMDEPSRAILVPANRFEVLECRAALDANYLGAQDTPPLLTGALDVLSQHVLGSACGAPFRADELYEEVRSAAPYATLDRQTFDRVVDFVATGGYALRTYERYARIRPTKDGKWRIANPRGRPAIPAECRHHRRNAGAQRALCQAGQGHRGARRAGARQDRGIFRRDRCRRATLSCSPARCCASRASARTSASSPMASGARIIVPSYAGGKFPLLDLPRRAGARHAGRSGALEAAAGAGGGLAALQKEKSVLPRAARSCWSKRFRAATATTWLPTRSKGGWRTRRSACC